MKTLIIISVLALSGCGLFQPALEGIGEKIGEGVNKYCAEVESANREIIREAANKEAAPNTIVATCVQ